MSAVRQRVIATFAHDTESLVVTCEHASAIGGDVNAYSALMAFEDEENNYYKSKK